MYALDDLVWLLFDHYSMLQWQTLPIIIDILKKKSENGMKC